MTPIDLLNSLTEGLREAVKDFELIAQYQPNKKVSLYVQQIPTVEFQSETFYPLICTELLNVEDTIEGGVNDSIASILITVGTYNGERADGWRDHLNLIEVVRQFILTNEILDMKFPLLFPAYTGIVEPRSENFSFTNLFVQYRIPTPAKNYCR